MNGMPCPRQWWLMVATYFFVSATGPLSNAQSPIYGGQLEPGGPDDAIDFWINGTGSGVGLVTPHAGIVPDSEGAAWLPAGSSGVRLIQNVDSAGLDFWYLDFCFATKLGDGGNAVQVICTTNTTAGAPNFAVRDDGSLAVRNPTQFDIVFPGVVAASIDANADNDFADSGDTLNVHRLRVVFRDWGTSNARYDLLLSEPNVLDGTFAHQEYGITTHYAGDPTLPANDSITQIRFEAQNGQNEYVLDNVRTVMEPHRRETGGDFEHGITPTNFTGWTNGTGTAEHFAMETDGLVSTSHRAVWVETAGSGSPNTLFQDVDSAGSDRWEVDFLFATKLGDGGNGMQFTLGNQVSANNVPNVTVHNNGDLAIRRPSGWEVIFPGAITGSIDSNSDNDFSDGGDTLNVYRMRVRGNHWGTVNANFDVFLSDANVVDGTFAHRHFGSTTFQNAAPTSPGSDSLRRINFQAGFSSNDYVVDNLSVRFSTQGPGFTQTTRTPGELVAEWDVGGASDANNAGRITTLGLHRGYLMTDTRQVTRLGGDGALQTWDISDFGNPREVNRGRYLRPFHVYFMSGDYYYNSNRSRFFDLSDMTDLREAQSPYTVPNSPQFRDWFVAPLAYLGQNGYGDAHQAAQIWDLRTGTLLASGPEGLDFETELGFEGQPFVIGNLMVVISSNINQAVATYDVSDPTNPVLLDVLTNVGGRGYEPAIYGHYAVLAFPSGPDHVTFVDFSDPADLHVEATISNPAGHNRYMQFQDEFLFIGDAKYDISDLQNITQEMTFDGGDEYLLPIGNLVAIASSSGVIRVFAHQANPDTRGPDVSYVNPPDGATGQALTSRIGVVIPESLDFQTITPQTFIVRELGGNEIAGTLSYNDKDVLTFTPDTDLTPNTTYEIDLPQGGICDISGNGLSQNYLFQFTTGNGGTNEAPDVTSVEPSSWPAPVGGSVDLTVSATDPENEDLEFQWDFGDGNPLSGWSSSSSTSHTFAAAGHYTVVVQVRDETGAITVETITVTVATPPSGNPPNNSGPIFVDESARRVWTVNPDNDTVTAIDADTLAKEFETTVGDHPVSLARANDGTVWVTCEGDGRIDILDGTSGAVVDSIDLGYGSGPWGIAFNHGGTQTIVALGGEGEVVRLSASSRAELDRVAVGPAPRAVAFHGGRAWVTRFISPLTEGQVWELDASPLSLTRTISLAFDEGEDTSVSGGGVPNYLTGVSITPDGSRAWVPAKKDNILRGSFFGTPLNHENTVRAIAAQIDLTSNSEVLADRIDFDNTALTSSVCFSPLGDYAFVTSLGNNEFEIVDTFSNLHTARIVVGKAPSGMAIDTTNNRIFVKDFLDRTVTVIDGDDFFRIGDITMPELAIVDTVASEALPSAELVGKQIFYDASDERMSLDSYMSCASCHLDGGQDGMVWDFTQRGEGLRNTITLLGRSGTGHGVVHWTGNFDEIQDFELDILNGFGGDGFIEDGLNGGEPWASDSTNPNAGRSTELDAMTAYVESLFATPDSPHRNTDGSLTAAGTAGKELFLALGCGACHSGTRFTDSGGDAQNPFLHDVGTWLASSGDRLGQSNTAFDTPSLRGVWNTGPYLHDGSFETLGDLFADQLGGSTVHDLSALTSGERTELIEYLLQIDDSEAGPEANFIHIGDDQWTQSTGWKTVTHGGGFSNPVVVCSPLTASGADPSVVRVRNVGPDSFQYTVEEWEYLDGAHADDERIHFIVMNAGTVTIDGKQITAGIQSGVNQGFTTPTFPDSFGGAPVVFAQVVTNVDAETVVPRIRNVSATSFEVQLQEEEASADGGTHSAETVHYIAVEPGDYPTLNARAGTSADAVTHTTYSLGFGSAVGTGTPLVMTGMQTRDGGDPCSIRWIESSLTNLGIDIFLEEEDSDGLGEFGHTTEVVGWWVFGF